MASALGTIASLMAVPTPAHAVLPANEVAVGIAGSDTTDKLLAGLAPIFLAANRTAVINGTTQTIRPYNIPALPAVGATFPVPGDTECSDTGWVRDPAAPSSSGTSARGKSPFGSTSGRNYLGAENDGTGPGPHIPGNPPTIGPETPNAEFGCVDVARSSSGPRSLAGTPLEKATFEYYAFAMDAVSWASTSLKAPATLTKAQIIRIYDCLDTDWAAPGIGGSAGPIQRYLPQVGSGTRDFFVQQVLGKATSYVFPTAGNCPAPVLVEENNAKLVLPADVPKAILPYSAGLWAFQEKFKASPSIDLRNGSRLGGISTPDAGPTAFRSTLFYNSVARQYSLDHPLATGGSGAAGVVKEENVAVNGAIDYPGVRYVYSVLDSVNNRVGYQAAFQLFGFQNVAAGFKSPMCDASPASSDPLGNEAYDAILSNFFAPLSSTGNIGGTNVAGATCRKIPLVP